MSTDEKKEQQAQPGHRPRKSMRSGFGLDQIDNMTEKMDALELSGGQTESGTPPPTDTPPTDTPPTEPPSTVSPSTVPPPPDALPDAASTESASSETQDQKSSRTRFFRPDDLTENQFRVLVALWKCSKEKREIVSARLLAEKSGNTKPNAIKSVRDVMLQLRAKQYIQAAQKRTTTEQGYTYALQLKAKKLFGGEN